MGSSSLPGVVSELTSADNLPTGGIEVLIRRHEMPDKICVSRYWEGMEKPERTTYVPERTCHRAHKPGCDVCSACGYVLRDEDRYCGHCGARIEVMDG